MTPTNDGGGLRRSCRAGADEAGGRLDLFLTEWMPDVSRNRAQNMIAEGAVLVNGAAGKPKNYIVRPGDLIEANTPPEEPLRLLPEDAPLRILFEDGDILVVNKQKGMVVHPAPGNEGGTLVNAVLFHCGDRLSSINGTIRPGIVHRIDKDTSGLLVVAKNDRAHRSLSEQFASHTITRRYEAVVYSNFIEEQGTVRLPVGRDPKNRLRQAVVSRNGRTAVTHYRVAERFGDFTRLILTLETGRTHQIRVHMAHIRHPILGDALYGPQKKIFGAETQMLHAGVLGFRHPATGLYVEFSDPPPPAFLRVLDILRRRRPETVAEWGEGGPDPPSP